MYSPKLLLLACVVFICLVIVVSVFRSCLDCDFENRNVQKAIELFSKTGSIKDILLFPTYPGTKTNLVSDTVFITSDSTIHSLQKMILDRGIHSWNHPTATWNVTLKANMTNGNSITWRISKIDNDRQIGITRISPGKDDCYFGDADYSPVLGGYLEQITGYTGVLYE